MTVSTTSRTTTYTGNGVTTTFATDFQFLLETDLVVTVDGVTKTLNSHYTVTGGDGSSGSVVFLAAPADAAAVIISRSVPLTQLTDYQPNDAFDAESHEQALDKLTQIDQQQQSAIERTFRVGPLEAEVAAISGDIGSKYLYLNAGKQLTAVTGNPTQPITHTTEYYYPTVGETVVPVSAYTQGSGDLSVFVNGVLQVLTVDYAETSNASVTMVTPLADGDVVILSIGDVFSVTLVSPGVSEQSFTGLTTPTLTLTSMSYQPGVDNVWVFFNGSKLASTDFTETNATTITLGFTPVAGDVIDVAVGQALSLTTVTRSGVGAALYPRTAAELSASVRPTDYAYPPGNLYRYGTNVTPGTTNMGTALASALLVSASHPLTLPQETVFCASALTVPDYGQVSGFGRASCVKKGFNGDLFTLNRFSDLKGFRIDGNKAAYTGRGVVIGTGVNSVTTSLHGQQLLEHMIIEDTAGYPVEYTVAHTGFMSKLRRCQFSNYSSDAAVKWPDETTTTGNRAIESCYSSDALVNVGGCDNGFIVNNTSGSANGSNGGIIFPASTTYRAKKLTISNNRFSMGGGTMTVRGIDSVFTDNIVSGSIVLASNAAADGCVTLTYDNNLVSGTFTDSSAATNYVRLSAPVSFTPTWTATGTAPAIGNSDVRCEYTRNGGLIRAKYWIKFGNTATFGTNTYRFSLPVNRYTALTTDFVGSAYLKDRAGAVRTMFQSGLDVVQLYTSAAVVTELVPVTWASTDVINFEIEYRIF